MIRRRHVAGIAVVLFIGVAAWRLIVRPIRMLREVGVGVPILEPGWSCARSGWVWGCHRYPPVPLRLKPMSYDLGTERADGQRLGLTFVQHQWAIKDSQLAGVRDSVRRTMVGRGALRHTCHEFDEALRRFDQLASARSSPRPFMEAWRLNDQDVLVGTAAFRDDRTGDSGWTVTVSGFADRVPACRPPQRHYRLLTLNELLGAVHRQIAEQIGF